MHVKWIGCCVFQPTFGFCAHLKAGRNTQQMVTKLMFHKMNLRYWITEQESSANIPTGFWLLKNPNLVHGYP